MMPDKAFIGKLGPVLLGTDTEPWYLFSYKDGTYREIELCTPEDEEQETKYRTVQRLLEILFGDHT